MKLVVTGATGYIGPAFADYALAKGHDVLALNRRKPDQNAPYPFMIPNDWRNTALLAKPLEGRDALIHCAGLAHGKPGDMIETNLDLTLHLAEAAIKAGTKRFIFISSAAVFPNDGVYTLGTPVSPPSLYGETKRDAETALRRLVAESDMQLSIIRPPMVIGPQAPGRSETLRNAARKNIPMPFGALKKLRSHIHIDHLIRIMLEEAQAEDKAALIHASDEALPVRDLIRLILAQDGLKAVLVPVPEFCLKAAATLLPPLRSRLDVLTREHVLQAGRKALDPLV